MKYLIFVVVGLVLLVFLFFMVNQTLKSTSSRKKICHKTKDYSLISSDTVSILTWNIGYGGLDERMDFFYDGGKKVVADSKDVEKNLNCMIDFLKERAHVDAFFIQEVDQNSKRSGFIDQLKRFSDSFSSYTINYGINYDVWFIPIPLRKPLGRVHSGVLTISRYTPAQTIRYPLPGQYSWPKNIFMPDRCLLVSRYPLTNGKELVLINVHLSAYDDGTLKADQLNYLKQFVLDQYRRDNYVIAGGDWNQLPPDGTLNFEDYFVSSSNKQRIPSDYLPDKWTWVYDPQNPTNRSLDKPFDSSDTPVTILDYFLISPNISAINVRSFDQQFAYSDHHPVELEVALK